MTDFPESFGRDPASIGKNEPSAAPSGTVHRYRPDIDGLRALAVLPVVFYHAGLRGFGGGYVGVDIFFVISGYLITGIIVRDLTEGRHSIARFYRRRILRILPALFFVGIATTAIACVLLLPDELVRYARSLAATALFGSNMLFYSESGYFDAASEVKPLLHTWSLAIEEQFYILWPLVLAWVGAARPGRLRIAVWAICAVSLAASIQMVAQDRSAAFYLLPSRIWELALGGALTMVSLRISRRWINEALAASGMAAILWCAWRYNMQTPFPGAGALPVCIGAALIILTGANGGTIVSRMLSIGPAVFVGKISYSLYLWHWPLLVFASLSLVGPPSLMQSGLAIAASFLAAIFSWRFVETPFRTRSRHWSNRAIFAGATIAIVATLGLAGVLLATNGLASRYTPEQQSIAHYANLDQENAYRGGTCFISDYSQSFQTSHCLPRRAEKPLVLLIGDSYAAHLWPGLSGLGERYDLAQANLVGCAPVLYPGEGGKLCERFFRSMLADWVPRHRPDAVLLAGRWHQRDFELLRQTLHDQRLAETRIIVIGPPPQYHTALPRLLVEAGRRGDPGLPMRFADRNVFAVDKELRRITGDAGTPYVSLIDKLCRQGQCRAWAKEGVPLQFDDGHFSEPGSRTVMHLIEDELDPIIDSAQAGRMP